MEVSPIRVCVVGLLRQATGSSCKPDKNDRISSRAGIHECTKARPLTTPTTSLDHEYSSPSIARRLMQTGPPPS